MSSSARPDRRWTRRRAATRRNEKSHRSPGRRGQIAATPRQGNLIPASIRKKKSGEFVEGGGWLQQRRQRRKWRPTKKRERPIQFEKSPGRSFTFRSLLPYELPLPLSHLDRAFFKSPLWITSLYLPLQLRVFNSLSVYVERTRRERMKFFCLMSSILVV